MHTDPAKAADKDAEGGGIDLGDFFETNDEADFVFLDEVINDFTDLCHKERINTPFDIYYDDAPLVVRINAEFCHSISQIGSDVDYRMCREF
jgi:hypothetical protein